MVGQNSTDYSGVNSSDDVYSSFLLSLISCCLSLLLSLSLLVFIGMLQFVLKPETVLSSPFVQDSPGAGPRANYQARFNSKKYFPLTSKESKTIFDIFEAGQCHWD